MLYLQDIADSWVLPSRLLSFSSASLLTPNCSSFQDTTMRKMSTACIRQTLLQRSIKGRWPLLRVLVLLVSTGSAGRKVSVNLAKYATSLSIILCGLHFQKIFGRRRWKKPRSARRINMFSWKLWPRKLVSSLLEYLLIHRYNH